MSSPYTPLVHLPQSTDENPTLLIIGRAESTDANGDGLSRSPFGAKASRYGYRSAQAGLSSSGTAETGKRLGFETYALGANTEKSRFVEKAGRIVGQNAQDVEIAVNMDKAVSELGTQSHEGGHGAGGKLRSSRRANKRTPYERPVTGRHATAGGSGGPCALPSAKKITLASRLRDSASRLIYSSASYLFPALFKRSSTSIKTDEKLQGTSMAAGQEGMSDALKKQNGESILANEVPALQDEDSKAVEPERSMLDIGHVEEILKQKAWSRDQVNRLTEILQKQVSDSDKANLSSEGKNMQDQFTVETKGTLPIQLAQAYMGEQAARPSGLAATMHGSVFLPSQVQSSPGGTFSEERYPASPFSRGWPRGSASVRIPKRNLAIEDDGIAMGPGRRVRQKTSMLTAASPYSYSRILTGLSKPLETRMSSPPSQSSQTAMKILETLERLSPSSQGKLPGVITQKSANGLQVLDKFSPHKGKVLDDTARVAAIGASEYSPEFSVSREKIVTQNSSLVVNGRSSLEGTKFLEAEAIKSLVAPSSLPESHNFSMLRKGFQMNAVFEETNSDEEAKSQAKPLSSSVARNQSALPMEDACLAPASSTVAFTEVDGSTPSAFSVQGSSLPSAALFLVKSSSPVTRPLFAAQDSTKNFSSSPSFSPSSAVETRSKLSDAAVSSITAAAAVSSSEQKRLTVSNSSALTSIIFPNPSDASELMAMSKSLVDSASASEYAPTALPISSSADVSSSGNAPTSAVGLGFSGSSFGVSSSVLTTPYTNINTSQSENVVNMATESPITYKQAEGETMATDNMAEEADTSMVSSPAFSVPKLLFNSSLQPSTTSACLFGAGSSGTLLSASAFSVGPGSNTGSAGASALPLSSPFAFGAQSGTKFAPNSLSGALASSPSATALTFVGQSSTSSTGQTPIFAAGVSKSLSSSSASPFAFGAQSGTTPIGQEPNLAVKPIFGVSTSSAPSSSIFAYGAQSGTSPTGQEPNLVRKPRFGQSSADSSGQTCSFEASPSSVANSFQLTAEGSSAFMFGSSNAAVLGLISASASLSSAFTLGSSALPSFAGASSTFQFGAPAMTSSLMSGPATSSTTSSFSTMSFPTSLAPTASVTPTFSFGAAAASSSAATAGSSATQPFSVCASQPNPFTVNPFASSGTQNTAFSFGSTAMVPAPSSFLSASSSFSTSLFGTNASSSVASVFAFGSASTSSPSPFAFGPGLPSMSQTPGPVPFTIGNQPAAASPNNGQPFGFNDGQPAAPNPFPAAGTTQTGLGFSLGRTGGDKSGRKFIKAKRIGSAKKGK